MSESLSPRESSLPFSDRSTGLLWFGILIIGFGCLSALLVALMWVGQFILTQQMDGPTQIESLIPGIVLYGGAGAALITLGIGSIQGRRWAPPLILVSSWSWLILGLISIISMVVILPKITGQAVTGTDIEGAGWIIMLISVAVFGIVFVVVPIPIILFYRRESVKHTCARRDPNPRWTDACPLPVLAAAVWLWIGAAMFAVMPLSQNGVFPFFGSIISGLPGSVICLSATLFWFWAGFGFYKLKPVAWWSTVAVFAIMMASALITLNRIDLMDMYREMGYPEEQLAQIEQFSFINSETMVAWTVLSAIPMFGFILYLKRYFRPRPDSGERREAEE